MNMPEIITDFLGEEDYHDAMNGECLAWREECVKAGSLPAKDGTSLHYYHAIPKDPKACVVIVHGLCEFFGKYHETAWYLYRSGYAFFFMEQRGHGLSGGKLDQHDVVHIDDYRTYTDDLDAFIRQVVQKMCPDLKKAVLAHSMGGAIAALYLEDHPGVFDAAYFSSPMFRLKAENNSAIKLLLFRLMTDLTGSHKKIAPGEKRFNGVPVFETSSALSKARYDYLFSQRVENRAYQTSAVSSGWFLKSIDATHILMRGASKIDIPVTVFSAGLDTLVETSSHDLFVSKVRNGTLLRYDDSKHEIFNAGDASRKRFFADLLAALT